MTLVVWADTRQHWPACDSLQFVLQSLRSRWLTRFFMARTDESDDRQFLDDSLGPEVDEELLDALVRDALPQDKAREVYRLIHTFQSWNDAHSRMLISRFRERKRDVPESD